jgi:hypothetical protein
VVADWRDAIHQTRMIWSRQRLRENADIDGARGAIGLGVGPRHEREARPYLQVIVVEAGVTRIFGRDENIVANNVTADKAKTPVCLPEN